MNKALNILSIDFDFFQIVNKDTLLTCYPDGHDLSTELSKIVWTDYYVNPKTKDKLNAVKANHKLIGNLQKKLKQTNKAANVLVANSHVNIYDFIMSLMEKHDKSKINIIHIDMHHDMFNNTQELDCGNWLNYIKDQYDTNVKWITNKTSLDIYGLDKKEFHMIEFNFNNINLDNIDAIFLCRSDIWLPPHLDYAFDKFLKFLCNYFDNVIGEPCIKSPRNMTELIENQKKLYEQLKNIQGA